VVKLLKHCLLMLVILLLVPSTVEAVSIVDLELEKNEYSPGETVSGEGRVVDRDGDAVQNADISVALGDQTKQNTRTDDEGTFDFSFSAPGQEGEHVAEIYTVKPPFDSDTAEISFQIKRTASLSIVMPSLTYIKVNESKEIPIYIENDGSIEINDIKPMTEDIPFESEIELGDGPLQMNENREAYLYISTPEDAETGILQTKIGFEYDGKIKTKTFGIYVEGPEETTGSITGGIIRGVSGMVSYLPSFNITSGMLLKTVLPASLAGLVLILVYYSKSIPVLGRSGRSRASMEEVKKSIKEGKEENGKKNTGNGVKREAVLRKLSFIKKEVRRGG